MKQRDAWSVAQRILLGCVLSIMFCMPVLSYAASDSFLIQSLVGNDTTAPSAPTSLTAVSVAMTQINLSWASSTDNFILSGYHVWRDDILIATTTVLQYSDTGLTASTTYTYYITAFDSSFNESASSTPAATSTFAASVAITTPSTGTTAYGSRTVHAEDAISRLQVFPEQSQVRISFDTTAFTRTIIRWGKTSSYEIGSLAEQAYTKKHSTTIVGLVPDTAYQFVIEGETNTGQSGVLHKGVFRTLPAPDTFPPGNVSNLNVTRKAEALILSWSNPDDSDFAKVRIVRNSQFYPSDIADGWVIYEGDGESTIDDEALREGSSAYYTVFSYDTKGNISSGSVIRYSRSEETWTIVDPAQNQMDLKQTDIIFTQDGETHTLDAGRVYIDGSKEFGVSIPYEAVPEHLKTIIAVLRNGDTAEGLEEISFLLRTNQEKTAYAATIDPLGVAGDFFLQLSIFDYKTMQIGYTDLIITSIITSPYETPIVEGSAQRTLLSPYFMLLAILLTITFLRYHEHRHL